MIEKLPFEITQGEYEGKKFDIKSHTSPFDMQDKINELIDIINTIVVDVDGTKCIDGSKSPAENLKLWQELIRTRKALDVAVDALKLMYQGNGDPQDIMRYIDNRWTPVRRLCKQTLEQITALEQKDVK